MFPDEVGAGRSPRRARRLAACRWGVALLGLVGAGCARQLGVVAGILGPEAYPAAMVLATGVEGRACRAAWLAVPRGEDAMADAVTRALATVPDATLLTEAEVETTSVSLGLYNRRCVRVRGSAARIVTQVSIPLPHHH